MRRLWRQGQAARCSRPSSLTAYLWRAQDARDVYSVEGGTGTCFQPEHLFFFRSPLGRNEPADLEVLGIVLHAFFDFSGNGLPLQVGKWVCPLSLLYHIGSFIVKGFWHRSGNWGSWMLPRVSDYAPSRKLEERLWVMGCGYQVRGRHYFAFTEICDTMIYLIKYHGGGDVSFVSQQDPTR